MARLLLMWVLLTIQAFVVIEADVYYQICTGMCHTDFMTCLQKENCHRQKWPVDVKNSCLEARDSSTKIDSAVNRHDNALMCYPGDDTSGYVPLVHLSMWTQPHCRVGSACPPSEAVTKGVTSKRTSHGAVAHDVNGSVGVIRSSVVA
ncbi:hypothetical protein LSAT2_001868 [Lamellibrachia satsuma]|nr:hypothetical protein LSAT2_001868 [Lamellibrachia satsuma]